jgi:hypothetical protein
MVAGARNKNKYNQQNVCTNHTYEICGCNKIIPQIKGIKREGIGSIGCVNNTKGDVYNQDKVG